MSIQGAAAHQRRAIATEDKCLYNELVCPVGSPEGRGKLDRAGVRFADVVTVLEDEFALTREDPDVRRERRFVTLGSSSAGAIVVVVYTHREPDGYRMISAWKADRRQRALYEEGRR